MVCELVDQVTDLFGGDLRGMNILEIGSGQGTCAAKLARAGASVIGVEQSGTAVRIATDDHAGLKNLRFAQAPLASRALRKAVEKSGPFDVVVANGMLDRVYDGSQAVANVRALLKQGGIVVSRSRNGYTTRNILADAFSKVFAVALLPPDRWATYGVRTVKAYYKRWPEIEAQFHHADLEEVKPLYAISDRDEAHTRKAVQTDILRIRRQLRPENYVGTEEFKPIRVACADYLDWAAEDVKSLDWKRLYHLYRAPVWDMAFKANGVAH